MRRIDRIIRNQAGLITRQQLREAGLSQASIGRRVSSGSLERVLPGVFRSRSSSPGLAQEIMAAYLWAGASAAISHLTAAYVLDLDGRPPNIVELTLPVSKKSPSKRIVLHRSQLNPGEVVRKAGMRVTSATRTLVDLSSTLPGPSLGSLTEAALRLELTSTQKLREAVIGRSGRRGVATLGAVVADLSRTVTDSELEVLLSQLLRANGLPPPVRQLEVRREDGRHHRIDFAYPDLKLCIECDGFAFHSGREAWQLDHEKSNLITAMGWKLLRFTWHDLCRRPQYVATLIRQQFGESPRTASTM